MSLLTLSDVQKTYGNLDVLTGVSFFVAPGKKVGLVGPNGAGKSTILRLITQAEDVDAGHVAIQPGTLVALLSQEPLLGDARTVLEAAQRPTPELQHVWTCMTQLEESALHDEESLHRHDELHHEYQDLGGYSCENRAKEVLAGLGFLEESWTKSVAVLSGGERTRLALVQILVRQPDLLLLDEPTNHVDWEAAEWLQDYLRRYPGAALIVSHDRYFLDEVAEEMVELERGRTRTYRGNYTAYRKKKAVELEQLEETYRRQQEEIARQQAVIQRLRSQRKFDSMHSRERVLDRMQDELVERPREARQSLKVNTGKPVVSGREVMTARDLSFAFETKPLFSGLSFSLERGERLAVIGPNGAGKTTLLKVIHGEYAARTGGVSFGFRVQPAYFAQDLSSLDPSLTVFDTIWETGALDLPETMQALHQFMFSGDAVQRSVADLSGGERTRLALCRLLVSRPNLLLLDEPTNHLDLASREAVERAFRGYPGALVVVSHDRYFLEAVATRILEIRPDGHRLFDGNYRHFREKLTVKPPAPLPSRKAAPPPPPRTRVVSASKRLTRVEAEIARLESRHREVAQKLGDPNCWHEPAEGATLSAEYEELGTKLEELYLEWAELAEQVQP